MTLGSTNKTFKDAVTFAVCELKSALNKTLEGNMLAWTTDTGDYFDYHAMSAGGCVDYFLDMFYWCIDYEIHATWRNRANSPYGFIDMPGGIVDTYEQKFGVSPEKFGVIFPFFACSFACSGSGPNYHGCPNATEGAANAKGGEDPWRGSPYIGEVFDFILPNASGKPWLNATTQTNVVNYHDGAGDLHQLWYDDAKTYAKKMEAVKQRGVRALGIWQAEGAGPHPEVTEALWAAVPGPAQKMDDDWTKVAKHDVGVASTGTVSLMTEPLLGDFEPDGWQGYACTFAQWTACVKSGPACLLGSSPCQQCRSKRGAAKEPIRCSVEGGRTKFFFPPGGIFPVVEQFTVPANTEIHGAANPNDANDKTVQQTQVDSHTWFVVPAANALCGTDPTCGACQVAKKGLLPPFCNDSCSYTCRSARGPTACSGDPRIHRQGFLMSSNTTLTNLNYQGADLGRSSHEGHLCGPGAIELPGCLSGDGCKMWDANLTNGHGPISNVLIQNVRLSDAVKRAEISQMKGNCSEGEALDADGKHVRAHQVSVWLAKLPDSETGRNANVRIDNLVSMNSRADGLNVHSAVDGLTLENGHIENSGDDCIGVWGAGIDRMVIRNMTVSNKK